MFVSGGLFDGSFSSFYLVLHYQISPTRCRTTFFFCIIPPLTPARYIDYVFSILSSVPPLYFHFQRRCLLSLSLVSCFSLSGPALSLHPPPLFTPLCWLTVIGFFLFDYFGEEYRRALFCRVFFQGSGHNVAVLWSLVISLDGRGAVLLHVLE